MLPPVSANPLPLPLHVSSKTAASLFDASASTILNLKMRNTFEVLHTSLLLLPLLPTLVHLQAVELAEELLVGCRICCQRRSQRKR
jgi:hypothetical protein